MTKLLLALVALAAPGIPLYGQSCAAPTGIQITGPVSTLAGPLTGTIALALNYTISGNPQMEQSQMQVQVKAGTLYYNAAALVCVPPGATVVASYTVNNPPPIVGTTKFTRNWTVPSSGGPYLVSAIECTPGAIGCLTTPNVVIAAGATGATGATGPGGPSGGPPGPTGPAGSAGAAGATGAVGAVGGTGPPGTGNAPYPATVTALSTLTVTAATHGQGIHPAGFCFDASTHSIACDWSADSSGNITFSWPGGFTGSVTILGGGTGAIGSTGAQGATGAPGPTGPAGSIGVFGSPPSVVGVYCPQVTVTSGPSYAYGWASCGASLLWTQLTDAQWTGMTNAQWTGMGNGPNLSLSWTGMTNSQWTAATNSQWTGMTN
jgi:hypothetical protein